MIAAAGTKARPKPKPKPSTPPRKEFSVQAEIVRELRGVGLDPMQTTAFSQRGVTKVQKGIPDLIVPVPGVDCTLIGIEVKREGRVRFTSLQQRDAHDRKVFFVAQSAREALGGTLRVLARLLPATEPGTDERLRLQRIHDHVRHRVAFLAKIEAGLG